MRKSNPLRRWSPAALLALTACATPTPTSTSRVDVSSPPQAQQAEPTPVQPAVTETAAEPVTEATDRWWVRTPDPVEGQVRVVASGRATKLMDARQLAVDNARDLLARSLGFTPEDATIERTSAEKVGELYTAWVLISAASNP